MRKVLFVVLLLILGCENNITTPESSHKKTERKIANSYVDTLNVLWIFGDNKDIYSGYLQGYEDATLDIIGNDIVNIKATEKISLNRSFIINSEGNLMVVNGFDASEYKDYVIKSDGSSYSPQRIPMWRGELNEDPLDGISGDNYYNLSTNKERIFVKNNWQDRK